MSILFRAVLIIGAILTMALMLRKIRSSEIKIADATFWFVFSIALVVVAIFPQLAFWASDILSIESPANFVFMCLFVVLILYAFRVTVELSQLRAKLTAIVQNEVLERAREQSALHAVEEAVECVEDERHKTSQP